MAARVLTERPRHLIHVGFPKAASTSLQGWFEAHPGLAFVPNGIAGYWEMSTFSRDVARGRGEAWYVTSSEHLVMPRVQDAHTDGLRGDSITERRHRACELLRGLFGEATILMVTRGFRGALASAYSQYVMEGGGLSLPELYARDESAGAVGIEVEDYWDYDAAVAEYEAAFGPENVIVLPYERLIENPAGFTAELEGRLALAPAGIEPPWVNTKLTAAELRWYPRFSRAVDRSARPFGARGAAMTDAYARRAGSPRLRDAASRLARVVPEPPIDLPAQVPEAALARCAARAVALTRRAEYLPYRREYLGSGT